jgi:predicted permease
MFKNIMSNSDSSLIPLIALIVCFLFFCFIVWQTMIMKKDEEQKLGEIPLNDKHNKIGDL